MRQKFLILILSIVCSPAFFAQECEWSLATVNAESGLILRKEAGKGLILTMPYGDTVLFCNNQSFGELEYEGIKGDWRKMEYQGKIGYAFDGFIDPLARESDSLIAASRKIQAQSDSILEPSKKPSLHPNFKGDQFQFLVETYNYCGDVSKLDLSLYWYGIFMDSEVNPSGELSIKPLDLKVSLSKEKVGKGMEFDLLTDQEERSLFLIGSDKVILHKQIELEDVLTGIQVRGKRLFPGQELILENRSGLRLSATGQITKTGPCPEAKDYKVLFKAVRNGKELKQNLASLIDNYGNCAIPELYWYGDLSGDGFPEIIFVSVLEGANLFHLLKSKAQGTELYEVLSVFRVENCRSNEH